MSMAISFHLPWHLFNFTSLRDHQEEERGTSAAKTCWSRVRAKILNNRNPCGVMARQCFWQNYKLIGSLTPAVRGSSSCSALQRHTGSFTLGPGGNRLTSPLCLCQNKLTAKLQKDWHLESHSEQQQLSSDFRTTH